MAVLALLIVLAIAFIVTSLVIAAVKWLLFLAVLLVALAIVQGWNTRRSGR